MQLETNRLLLQTLDLQLIEAAAKRDTLAIEALGYKTNGEWPGQDFYEASPYFRELLMKNNGTRGFDSWIMVLKDTREIIGGIGFLGDPGPEGTVEIGFATNESHRRQGYCLEATEQSLNWAENHPEVRRITARCELENNGSKNILTKLGFKVDRTDEEIIYWSYPK
ncbi:GNAT family N-acetyltransferase [Paenibacillus sp. P25]|nr:GNAT family N-acetyltransferase [Paenibacillus sp. P25]